MKVSLPARSPRNPHVAPSLRRVAGAHRRGTGGLRQQAKQSLRRLLRDEHPPSP